MNNELVTKLVGEIAALAGILFVLLGFMAVYYISYSLAIFRAAKVDGVKYPWLAFIPIVQDYIMFKIAGGNPIFLSVYIFNFMGILVPNEQLAMVCGIMQIIYTVYYLVMLLRVFKEFNMGLVWGLMYFVLPAVVGLLTFTVNPIFIIFSVVGPLVCYWRLFYQTYQERY